MVTRGLVLLLAPVVLAAPPGEGENEEPEHTPAPAPAPAPPPARPGKRPSVVIEDGMVKVSGGKFTMGASDRRARPNERPARIVSVAPFWIDRTEVTVGAYRACVERGACRRPARSNAACTYDRGDPRLPVSCVSWAMADAFCRATKKRLPREVEWEMAARGPSPIRYPWGNGGASCATSVTLLTDATQRSCGKKGPLPVGSRPAGASPFGALDMSGNVEEWVADWYGETNGALSPRAGASHVLRGGGWLTPPSQARTTSRSWGSALEAGPNVGLRCARDA